MTKENKENVALGKRILDGAIKFIMNNNKMDDFAEYLSEVHEIQMTYDKEDLGSIMFDDRRPTNDNEIKDLSGIEKVENEYPQTTELFKQITKNMYIIFCIKQADYGPDNITLGGDINIPQDRNMAILGIIIRMNDKVQRLLHLTRDGLTPNNESIEDSLVDLGNYAIMTIILTKGVWSK